MPTTPKIKKLTPKIEFEFREQDIFPEFNVDMKLKTRGKTKHIKIVKQKKVIDASTKLF
jgi:hypothetical protein